MTVSFEHEILRSLFVARPALAAELLDVLDVAVPPFDTATIESSDLSQLVPAQFHADVVTLFSYGDAPVLSVVVEVQRAPDPAKRGSWPVYVATLAARHACAAAVLVVATTDDVAAWARGPIAVGPGFVLHPFVLAPGDVPVITDPDAARRDPELAVLSAYWHAAAGDRLAVDVALAATEAVRALDDERAKLYLDVILSRLGDVARAALEVLMRQVDYEYQSDFARRYVAEGRAEGRAEGKAEGEASAVLAVLRARNIVVSDVQRARVLACTDLPTLDRWVIAAVTATSADELTLPVLEPEG